MWFGAISLFPEMFAALTDYGVTRRAHQLGLMDFHCWNPRDFTKDKHRTVDDRPYGGGPGMLMKVKPLQASIRAARKAALDTELEQPKVIYLSPQGKVFNQKAAISCVEKKQPLIFVAGRYEGVDERLLVSEIDEEWSVGDIVLSGGEFAALVVIDTITRLIPGVLGNNESAQQDSFSDGLLDHPHYTRPEVLDGQSVPQVLLSGNHANILRWRKKESLGRTWLRRPDILKQRTLNEEEKRLLNEFIDEYRAR
ncbi:MAG: tRNA (guanosine(37)-N1)-methyltransferase TrmD [Pseudomonadota bacterium]